MYSSLKLLNFVLQRILAILGYDPGKKSVAISYEPKHREILSNALGLSISISNSMIESHMVNLHAVIVGLINKHTHGVSNNMQKNFGLALCFMGEFLLCSGRPSFVDARAIGVVSQVKDGDNPASLILVETLLGLDFVFLGGKSQQFPGSPLSLQIWLMERLDMIAKPTVANYGPSNFLSKIVLKTKCQTESDWVKFLNKKSSISIRWDCYWWKCPPPLLWSPRLDHIFLVGLRKATFYKANRILRQFQYEQGMPARYVSKFAVWMEGGCYSTPFYCNFGRVSHSYLITITVFFLNPKKKKKKVIAQ